MSPVPVPPFKPQLSLLLILPGHRLHCPFFSRLPYPSSISRTHLTISVTKMMRTLCLNVGVTVVLLPRSVSLRPMFIAPLLSDHHRCHFTRFGRSADGGGSRTNSANHMPFIDHSLDMCRSCRSRIHHLLRCLVNCIGVRHLQQRIQSLPLLKHARPVPMVSRQVSTRLYYDVRLLTTWIKTSTWPLIMSWSCSMILNCIEQPMVRAESTSFLGKVSWSESLFTAWRIHSWLCFQTRANIRKASPTHTSVHAGNRPLASAWKLTCQDQCQYHSLVSFHFPHSPQVYIAHFHSVILIFQRSTALTMGPDRAGSL